MDNDKARISQLENTNRQLTSELAGEKSKRQHEQFQAQQTIAQLQTENAALKRKLREHRIS